MELTLYQFDECPYCQKVQQFLGENDIEIPFKNTMENPEYREELISIGGTGQVPCLVIDGKPLYESDDIIARLKANKT